MSEEKEQKKGANDPILFFVGLVLLAVGLFMLSRRVIVSTSFATWRIWGDFGLSSGTVVIPLIIGIIWYFYNPKSIASKIIMVLGAIIIVTTIIMSVRINFVTTSMFDYILILAMIAAGVGLLLKTFHGKKKE